MLSPHLSCRMYRADILRNDTISFLGYSIFSTALPSLPLHRVQERPEDFDSDSDDSPRLHPSIDLPPHRKEEEALSTKENTVVEVSSPVVAGVREQEGAEIDTIREQLTSLENMYKEMLKVVGAKNAETKTSPRGHPGSLKKGYGITRSASKVKRKSPLPCFLSFKELAIILFFCM